MLRRLTFQTNLEKNQFPVSLLEEKSETSQIGFLKLLNAPLLPHPPRLLGTRE